MGIQLSFTPHHKQTMNLFTANAYAPQAELETNNLGILTKFYEMVESHLLQLPSTTLPILGGDFNAAIGICTSGTD
jgi:hypothetical protein